MPTSSSSKAYTSGASGSSSGDDDAVGRASASRSPAQGTTQRAAVAKSLKVTFVIGLGLIALLLVVVSVAPSVLTWAGIA